MKLYTRVKKWVRDSMPEAKNSDQIRPISLLALLAALAANLLWIIEYIGKGFIEVIEFFFVAVLVTSLVLLFAARDVRLIRKTIKQGLTSFFQRLSSPGEVQPKPTPRDPMNKLMIFLIFLVALCILVLLLIPKYRLPPPRDERVFDLAINSKAAFRFSDPSVQLMDRISSLQDTLRMIQASGFPQGNGSTASSGRYRYLANELQLALAQLRRDSACLILTFLVEMIARPQHWNAVKGQPPPPIRLVTGSLEIISVNAIWSGSDDTAWVTTIPMQEIEKVTGGLSTGIALWNVAERYTGKITLPISFISNERLGSNLLDYLDAVLKKRRYRICVEYQDEKGSKTECEREYNCFQSIR